MKKIKLLFIRYIGIFCLCLCGFLPSVSVEAASTDYNYHTEILNEISNNFKTQSKTWVEKIKGYAIKLFWLLAGISLAWTAIELALKHAEIGEIFAELSKYIIFTGFFSFLLLHGPSIAEKIFDSFSSLGAIAAGLPKTSNNLPSLNPSDIVELGLNFYQNITKSLQWDLGTLGLDLVSMVLGILFFVFCLLIAIKVLIQLIALWCLMYGGAFFLGFGGCKWTQDIAKNYFKAVLIASTKYFAMLFIVGIMNSLATNLMASFTSTAPVIILEFLVLPILFLLLLESVPEMIAGIASGNFSFSTTSTSSIASAATGAIVGAATGSVVGAKGISAGVKSSASTVSTGIKAGAKAIDYAANNNISTAAHDFNVGASQIAKNIGNKISLSAVGQGAKATGQIISATGSVGAKAGSSTLKATAAAVKATATGVKATASAIKSHLPNSNKNNQTPPQKEPKNE